MPLLTPAQKPRTKFYAWRGVRFFEAGNQKGEVYTTEDIDSMVFNFNAYSVRRPNAEPLLEVPIVLGHDKNQILLRSTGLTAAGWVYGMSARWDVVNVPQVNDKGVVEIVPHEGYFLFGKVGHVPELAKEWVEDGQYRYVSVEISKRNTPPPGLKVSNFKGFCITRVAILGASDPYVKTLGPLPVPEPADENGFSSTLPGFEPALANLVTYFLPIRRPSAVSCFSEEFPMNETLMQLLRDQGIPDEVAQGLAKADPACYSKIGKAFSDVVSSTFDRTGAIEKLSALPNSDRDSIAKMTDDELKAMMAKNYSGEGDQKPAPAPAPTPPKPAPTSNNSSTPPAFSDKDDEEKKGQMSAVLQAQRKLERDMNEFKRWQQEQTAFTKSVTDSQQKAELARKCEEIDAFCAQLASPAERRLTPAEQKFYANVMKKFVILPADTVTTFSGSDGKSHNLHPLEALKRDLQQRPQHPAHLYDGSSQFSANGSVLDDKSKPNKDRVGRMLAATEEGRLAMANKAKK